MRKLFCIAAPAAALILVASAADTAAPQKKAPVSPQPAAGKAAVAPKTAPKQASKTPAAGKGGAKTTSAARRTTSGSLPRRPTTTWRNRQVAPTPDRYKEIQGALAAKGYLQPDDATGKWDPASVEAMKKFQADQKLDSTGKVNSLSLIALGLGPKYDESKPAGQEAISH